MAASSRDRTSSLMRGAVSAAATAQVGVHGPTWACMGQMCCSQVTCVLSVDTVEDFDWYGCLLCIPATACSCGAVCGLQLCLGRLLTPAALLYVSHAGAGL